MKMVLDKELILLHLNSIYFYSNNSKSRSGPPVRLPRDVGGRTAGSPLRYALITQVLCRLPNTKIAFNVDFVHSSAYRLSFITLQLFSDNGRWGSPAALGSLLVWGSTRFGLA